MSGTIIGPAIGALISGLFSLAGQIVNPIVTHVLAQRRGRDGPQPILPVILAELSLFWGWWPSPGSNPQREPDLEQGLGANYVPMRNLR
ncbi:hypothetical protein N7491_005712 [Penicillium cf. griseofulvum]|uniref:Uncharacterized protein n=1 Tax=Penicillium cf. griseofulvum TaxID=2972120 RepID=A0A9W9J420_9EURO|nr:hypothetical protein N7472_008393 [Penicillium cf. griseofulvum]KAJ5435117.1 hypothetical protein N7491_005712 [Penicillium cf. griseofulvum]KAJ5452949.1 hypothetical protein N7445_001132 [Penicillium cf. griseofulvum]